MSIKTTTGMILFADVESTYGQGAVLTGSADTIQVAMELPLFNIEYSFDGSRQGAQYSAGNLQPAGPNGKTTSGTVKIEGKGLGSAYSNTAAGHVPNLHPFLLSAGMSASFQSSTWVYKYTPLGTDYQSIALEVYDRGEKLPISGAFSNMKVTGENGGITIFSFDVKGSAGSISDVSSPPARVWYGQSTVPPVTDHINMNIGGFSAGIVRKFDFDAGIDLTPRLNINTSGSHAGFVINRRKPVLNVSLESTALSTMDAYTSWSNSTATAVSFQVGSVNTNKFSFSFPQASITKVERANDGAVALWNLSITPYVSAPDTTDDLTLTFG